jgi:hypothetical protein
VAKQCLEITSTLPWAIISCILKNWIALITWAEASHTDGPSFCQSNFLSDHKLSGRTWQRLHAVNWFNRSLWSRWHVGKQRDPCPNDRIVQIIPTNWNLYGVKPQYLMYDSLENERLNITQKNTCMHCGKLSTAVQFSASNMGRVTASRDGSELQSRNRSDLPVLYWNICKPEKSCA